MNVKIFLVLNTYWLCHMANAGNYLSVFPLSTSSISLHQTFHAYMYEHVLI